MLSRPHVTLDAMVDTLKAAAESSRLRILALLSRGDLTVSDLTEILNQSQPRVSRHLKLLLEAGLIGRYQEGSWAFFRLSDDDVGARIRATGWSSRVHDGDPQIERDLRAARRGQAQAAGAGGRLFLGATPRAGTRSARCMRRTARSRRRIRKLVGKRPFQSMLDLGTGTGRLLELFAPLYRRGVGIDMSREMLAVARANLDKAGVTNAQVRQGDIYAPPVERDAFDLVTIHQVLHYLDDPQRRSARRRARCGRPAGWSSSTSPRTGWNSCARSMRMCGSASPTGRSPNGSREAGLDLEETPAVRAARRRRAGADRKAVARPRPPPADRRSSPQADPPGKPPDVAVPLFASSPHRRQGPRLLRVLPAEDRRDGGAAVGHGHEAAAAEAAFRLGDLWRRRLDARAHRPHGAPHPDRIEPDAGRAPHLRRRQPRRGRPGHRRIRGDGRQALRGAARRPGRRRRRDLPAASGRLCQWRRAGGRAEGDRAISTFPSPPIRKSIRKARISRPTSRC